MIETLPITSVEPVDKGAKIVPGTFVTYPMRKGSFGTVVAVQKKKKKRTVVVIWSKRGDDPFSKFVMPVIRRTFTPAIAPQLVSIQPMTRPVGSIFYIDYQYGSGSFGSGSK